MPHTEEAGKGDGVVWGVGLHVNETVTEGLFVCDKIAGGVEGRYVAVGWLFSV